MNRRTFLRASAGLGLAAALPAASVAAAGWSAAKTMEGAEKLLGTPYIYGGNDPARGLDCSSYISLIWGIPRQSTDTIHNYSFEIAKNDLMPGDAMNFPFRGRPSHIRLFAGWATEDRSAAWVYECAFRRGTNTRPIAYDPRYTPIRRHNFVPDVAMPEPKLPADHEVTNGRFFSQPVSKDGLSGFAVFDRDGVSFWSEFRRLGGVEALGYPISRRFDLFGAAAQRFEKGFLRWLPDRREAVLIHGLTAPPDALVPHPSPLTEPLPV
jgi:hypothetical protein